MDYNTLNKIKIHVSIQILIYINKREWKILAYSRVPTTKCRRNDRSKKMGAKISGQMFNEDRIFTDSKYVKYIITN